MRRINVLKIRRKKIKVLPFVRRRTSATTASFSIGLNEQVEYTIRPPILVKRAPRRKIWT